MTSDGRAESLVREHDNRKRPIQSGWIGSPSRGVPDPGIIELNFFWAARHEHSAYVFQDKIWVVGGHSERSGQVWSLRVPHDWL